MFFYSVFKHAFLFSNLWLYVWIAPKSEKRYIDKLTYKGILSVSRNNKQEFLQKFTFYKKILSVILLIIVPSLDQ